MTPTPNSIPRTLIVRPAADPHPLREKLSLEINSPEFVAGLLLQRGIEEKEMAREFFLAPLKGGLEAKDLLGLSKAVEILLEAHRKREKIVVHGDYDVDGVTGTALLYSGLKRCGFEVDWFLPNRFVEGYGISRSSVGKIRQQEARWIISVDTGISASAEVSLAKELGMGVIITDHHQAPEILPDADAIINPHQPGCTYGNKGLCGVGVAYKLLNELSMRLLNRPAEEYLDLVALGSLADSVPLVGENRSLVRSGLRLLASSPRLGMRALFDRLGIGNGSVSSGDILFKVAPLINAMGRMGSPETAVKLLLSERKDEAVEYARLMWEENAKRKELDQGITEEAMRMVAEDPALEESACLVLASRDWHEGVIGIVAARMVDKYRRPVFILAIDKMGVAKGSGRTVTGFNLHKALGSVPELFEKWGGHYYACGFSIREENIDLLRLKMDDLAKIHLAENDFIQRILTSVEIPLNQLNQENMLWLSRFEPFGPLNEKPLFYSENVALASPSKIVGDKHLKFSVDTGESSLDAIGFNLGYLQGYVEDRRDCLKLAYYPEWNVFRGMKRIQLRIIAVE